MDKLAFVISKNKPYYGPMVDAAYRASKKMGFDFLSLDDDLRGYEQIIVFDSRFRKPLKRSSFAKVGWWMNDLRLSQNLSKNCKYFVSDNATHIFLCNEGYKKDYEDAFGIPVYYMPQCGLEFKETKERDVDWDILFIGKHDINAKRYHRNRKEIIDKIEDIDGYTLKIIGNEGTTPDQRYLYHHTPINISISLPVTKYTSNRLYNILASKGFALTLYFPGIEKLFENRKHLVWFDSPREARELSEYYINHEQERREIAENGHRLFLEKHRAKHRIQNMFDIMNNKTNEFYGYKE